MAMWLNASNLVFFTVVVAAVVTSGQDSVTLDDKNQRSVKVLFGSALNFNCNLTTSGYSRFLVSWYFNPTGPSFNETHNMSTEICNQSAKTSITMKTDRRDTQATFLKCTSYATEENSGWYFCKITAEIPTIKPFESSGRQVIIMKKVEHTRPSSLPVVTAKQETASPANNFQPVWLLWIAVGVAALILIVLLIVCILLRRRYRTSRAEDPIYANTRPVANKQPTPRPGLLAEDNLKEASSSHNLHYPSPDRRHNRDKQRYK